MKNYVAAGDYENHLIYIEKGVPYIELGRFRSKKIFLSRDDVSNWYEESSESKRSLGSAMVRSAVGGAILGPAGALAGAASAKGKSKRRLVIEWSDGKRSLLDVEGDVYDAIEKNLF